jgi:hypothetical protein
MKKLKSIRKQKLFDVSLGNSPYQDSSHNEKKNSLWRKFIDKNLDLVKDGGVVSNIIPSSWMGSVPLLQKNFLPYNLLTINKDECKRHFPAIGSHFSYFILTKEPYKNQTNLTNKEMDGTVVHDTIDLNTILYGTGFPRNLNKQSNNILSKVLDPTLQKLGIINACTHHNVHRERWRLKPTKQFCYPVQNTPSKVYYFNYPHPDQNKLKLCIPTSTQYINMIITTNGVTQGMCYFNIPEGVDPNVVLHNMKNKLFVYVNDCFRYSNWNSVQLLRLLPTIPFTSFLTNEECYKLFNLAEDEIELIERTIP